MTTNVLPVSNVINVSVTDTPSGLTEKNVNSIALFTQDAPENSEAFGIYIAPSQVASNYGTDSLTAQMANNLFAQLPNLLSGRGRLVIIPMLAAVSATPGNVQTANLSANLAGIIAINNGDLNVVIESNANNLTHLDFTSCTTWAQIAAVIQAKLTNGTVTALTNGIKIESHKVGSGSTVTLAAVSGGAGTNMNGASYFNGGTSTPAAGANSSGETILQCRARTIGLVGYVPIMSTLDLEDAAISTAAAGIQALDAMFFQHVASTEDILGIATTVSQAEQKKTRILLHTNGMATANLYKASYVGRACSVDFTGSFTSSTMNLKQLANVTPDTGITQTFYDQCLTAGCDIYVSYDGVPSVVSTGGNDFFDNPYSDLALKFYLETAGFNYLRRTNTKIPQTEPGMAGLKDAYAQVCQQFVRNGSMAPGAWDSGETFGDPVIFNNNITNNGYYIYSLPVAQQNSSDRDNRIAPLVQIAIKRAGAIHKSNVIVIVNA